MCSKPDSCVSDLGSIPGQGNFLENFIVLNSSKIRWELWKNSTVYFTHRLNVPEHQIICCVSRVTMKIDTLQKHDF